MSGATTTITANVSSPIKPNLASTSREKVYRAALACNDRVRQDAYALRYASYLDSGFIGPSSEKSFSDAYDALPSATTIVVYEEDRAVASVRVCFISRKIQKSPAYQAFPDEVSSILADSPQSKKNVELAEITRLVRSPECANNQGLVFLLYRLAGHLVLRNDVQVILSSVRRNHIPFYRRIGFVDVAGPRAYPGLTCPMHLLQCSRAEYDRVRRAFPLMDPEATPVETFDGFAAGRPISIPLMVGR
ncbi:MAG TPA: hypothetical protein VHO91_21160 [Rhodopila sp.]|nr:hypothetical protein [Rhodopila sp.]